MKLDVSLKELVTHTVRMSQDNTSEEFDNVLKYSNNMKEHEQSNVVRIIIKLNQLAEGHVDNVQKNMPKDIKNMKPEYIVNMVRIHMEFFEQYQDLIEELKRSIPEEQHTLLSYNGEISASHYEFVDEALAIADELQWEEELNSSYEIRRLLEEV